LRKAQGSIGSGDGGNTGTRQRTRRRNKALRSRRSSTSVMWRQRREGRSPGDRETAAEEGKAPKGGTPRRRVGCRRMSVSGSKPGEPHDRLRGATNPQSSVRSKPSKSGGTTRTERVRDMAMPEPRETGSGRTKWMSMEGRSLKNPMRGARKHPRLRSESVERAAESPACLRSGGKGRR
jgi:hypothetical protein